MRILCPPPSLSSRSTAQIKVLTRANREKFKQVVIIYPTLLHTSNYREHKGRRKEDGSREEAQKQSSMCLEVGKTMGGVIQAAPPLQMRQFGRFLDSSLRVVRR